MVLKRLRIALVFFLNRVAYSFNWTDVGAALPFMAKTFDANTAEMGLVLGAFFGAVGVFQIPAGFAALKWGARNVALGGLFLMGVAALLSAWPVNLDFLILLRFLVGTGAAFFFSPGLELISSYFPEGKRGPIVGLYSAGASLGSTLGLVGGATIAIFLGWTVELAVGGISVLVMFGVSYFLITPEQLCLRPPSASNPRSIASSVFRSRSIWALAFGLIGAYVASTVMLSYLTSYFNDSHQAWGIGTAAFVAAAGVLASVAGSPLGGYLSERGFPRRTLLTLLGMIFGALVLLIPFVDLFVLALIYVGSGVLIGAIWTIVYVIPTYLTETRGHGIALAAGFINSVQLISAGIVSPVFGIIVLNSGYNWAWILAGFLVLVFLPLMILIKPDRTS